MTLHSLQTRTAAETALAEQFAAAQAASPAPDREASFRAVRGQGPADAPQRGLALHRLALRCSPASRRSPARPTLSPVAAAKLTLTARTPAGAAVLAIVDGRYVPELSDALPDGVSSRRWRRRRASPASTPMAMPCSR